MGDDGRPGPGLPAADRVRLLPLLRPARGLPPARRRRASGSRSSTTGPATASSGCSTPRPTATRPWDGLYKPAEQRWQPEAAGLSRFRRAVFPLPDFDPGRTQNHGASFRLEFRRELARLAPRGEPRSPARPRGLPRGGAAARAAQDAGAPLPHQLPLRRDHERLQLQVHVVPGRDHGPPPRLHEEGARLPPPRRDRGEAGLARPPLPGEAPPDGRAHAAPGPAGDRGPRRGARGRDRAEHELRPHHRGARRGPLPRRPHQPHPLVPDPRPRDLQDPQGPEARVRRVPRQGPPGRRAQGGPRRAHDDRDRHHEHEARRRLPHRQRGRAGARLPLGLDRLRPGARAALRPPAPDPRLGEDPRARASSTRTRTAAATRCSTASTSSGSAATPGAT